MASRGPAPIDLAQKRDVAHAQDIMLHYARKGLSPIDVRSQSRRHARLLSALDPGVAVALGHLRAGEAVAMCKREDLEKKRKRFARRAAR